VPGGYLLKRTVDLRAMIPTPFGYLLKGRAALGGTMLSGLLKGKIALEALILIHFLSTKLHFLTVSHRWMTFKLFLQTGCRLHQFLKP
jgi:hypothetical protein